MIHGAESRKLVLSGAVVIGLAIFLVDGLTDLRGSIAVLYIAVPLLLASAFGERTVLLSAAMCLALTVIAFFARHWGEPVDDAHARFVVSLAAIVVATLLALKRERSERRYSAIFNAAGFATWESDWSEVRRFVREQTAHVGGDVRAFLVRHPDVARKAAEKARIREINQAAVTLFEATSRRDLVGANIIGRGIGDADRGFIDILTGLLAGAEMVEAETRLTTLKGRTLDVILRVTLVHDGEAWSRALVMAFDETERKEARARLEQTSAELAHAARVSVLGQLAASIAHEVNQPLTAIVAYGKSGKRWLSRAEPDVPEAVNCLDSIVSAGSRAAEIIARVRSLARNTAPRMEPLDLADVAEEGVALVQHEAAAAHVGIRRTVAADLPLVIGDRVQIQQVLVNLLVNGIQAMREVEGRERELHVVLARASDSAVSVSVQDTGPGLSVDNPERIFAPFFTTKSDGMGMGLSICRSIVEAQGGAIRASNNPDHGATIAFTLPAHSRPTGDAGASKPRYDGAAPSLGASVEGNAGVDSSTAAGSAS